MATEYSKDDLIRLARRMDGVATMTYWLFFNAGMGAEAHAFIEFCGVLNKYVEICQRCAEHNIDFTAANVHGGEELPVATHDMEYLGEKLACIFGPMIDANPGARAALKTALFGKEAT